MARINPAPEGAFIDIVNPARPVGLTRRETHMADLKPVAGAQAEGGKKRKTRRRRNPGLAGMVSLLLPLMVGGGIGYIEATQPEWWGKIDAKFKAVGFAAVAVVAAKKGMREAAGAATAFAGLYAVRAGIAWHVAKTPADAAKYPGMPKVPVDPAKNLNGLLGAAGVNRGQVDEEMNAAFARMRAAAAQGGPVGQLNREREELGGLSPNDGIENGLNRRFADLAAA